MVYLAQPVKLNTAPKKMDPADEIEEDEEEDEGREAMDLDPGRGEGEDGATNKLKFWIGPFNEDENGQVQTSLDRFESKRLGKSTPLLFAGFQTWLYQLTNVTPPPDEFLPTKPGHILNAGGPVQGLAWCPHADGVNSPSKSH